MGNRPKQIGPKLFIFRHNRRRLFFPGILGIFQGKGTLAENGKQNAVFENIQRLLTDNDADDAINPAVDPYRQIQASGAGKRIRCRPRMFIIFQYP